MIPPTIYHDTNETNKLIQIPLKNIVRNIAIISVSDWDNWLFTIVSTTNWPLNRFIEKPVKWVSDFVQFRVLLFNRYYLKKKLNYVFTCYKLSKVRQEPCLLIYLFSWIDETDLTLDSLYNVCIFLVYTKLSIERWTDGQDSRATLITAQPGR